MRISLIGCGFLGSRVAGELYMHGHFIAIHDVCKKNLDSCKAIIEDQINSLIPVNLQQNMNKGILLYFDDLCNAVQNSKFVIECIPEDVDSKISTMTKLDEICDKDAVIVTSSSPSLIRYIFPFIPCSQRFLGLRFIFPVHCIPFVQLTTTPCTSLSSIQFVKELMEVIGKEVIMTTGDNQDDNECIQITKKEAEKYKNKFLEKLVSTPPPSVRLVQAPSTSPLSSSSPQPSSSSPLQNPSSSPQKTLSKLNMTKVKDDLKSEYGCSPSVLMECVICMEGHRDTLLRPCNHLITCNSCSWKLISSVSSCPICRAEIKEILHVFRS